MPLDTSGATSELGVAAPTITPNLPPGPTPAPDATGTGALGPKYSNLDVLAAASRESVVGKFYEDQALKHQFGYGTPASPWGWPGREVDTEGLIPHEMQPWKDKYFGLHTQGEVDYKTAQIKTEIQNQQAMSGSWPGRIAALAIGQSDPAALASLMIPIAGASRLANAIRMAAVGGGVSTIDELLLHQMDPLATREGSILNVGAGTLLSGVLGGLIRGRVPQAEFERLRSRLQADLERRVAERNIPPGDNAASIANDVRSAVETHGQSLQMEAEGAGQAAAHLAPEEVAARVQAAEERLRAAGEPLAPETRREAVAAEGERLQQPEAVKQRLEETYGEQLPAVLAERAEAGVTERERAAESERAAALKERDAALADQGRIDQAAKTQGDLERFHRGETESDFDIRPTADGNYAVYRGETPISQRFPTEAAARTELSHALADVAGEKTAGAGAKPKVMHARITGKTAISSAPAVEAHVFQQLESTGRFDPKTNRAYAGLIGDFYATQAKRLGIPADELFQRHPLTIAGEAQPGGLLQALRAPFYSAAIRGVESIATARASGEQWSRTLDNLAAKGVTKEELDWLGVKDWLSKQSGQVSREALLDHMRANEVKVKDVTLAGGEQGMSPEATRIVEELKTEGYQVHEDDVTGAPYLMHVDEHGVALEVADGDVPDHIRDLLAELREGGSAGPTRFERWQLPGGSNYRELLLTLPEGRSAETYRVIDSNEHQLPRVYTDAAEADADAAKLGGRIVTSLGRSPNFTGGHFETPNVLAHVRTNERVDADGRRVLHIEEIQSDWHQKGRREGYAQPETPELKAAHDAWVTKDQEIRSRLNQAEDRRAEMASKRWAELKQELGLPNDRGPEQLVREVERIFDGASFQFRSAFARGNATIEHDGARIDRQTLEEMRTVPTMYQRDTTEMMALRREIDAHHQQDPRRGQYSRVPDAPFKKTWPELALKRMVRYAAEQGIDRITWTTGEQQAARYDLSEAVDRIRVDHDLASDRYSVQAHKNGRLVADKPLMRQEELANLIGKNMADKAVENAAKHRESIFEGGDLKIGGEGMKGFYDKILPAAANKLAKRFGGKVGETRVETVPARVAGPQERSAALTPTEEQQLAALRESHRADGLSYSEMRQFEELARREAVAQDRPAVTESVHSLDIPKEMRDAALGGQPLFQGNRGQYNPESNTIALLEHADASTFLHESGHHFLDISMQLASHEDAPLEMREDAKTLMDWFHVKDLDAWHGMGLEEQRPYHEQFARGFERYLREGVAPSTRLEAVFAKFRDWLVNLYKTMTNFGSELTPEVRAVMDRMVASADEAKAAREARIAREPTAEGRRLAGDDNLRNTLRIMAENEGGWAQVGGLHPEGSVEGYRTSWIPNSDWWPGRPGGYNTGEVQNAVEKALAGEKLGDKQARLVEYMTEVADQRVATEPYFPHPDELVHPDDARPTDPGEAAMVARLGTIDEAAVENLARHFEDDRAGFMGKVKEMLDAHDTDARLARVVPQDQEPHGDPEHGVAAHGSAFPAGLELHPTEGGGAGPATGEPTRPAATRDLFGTAPTGAQGVADATRTRDLKRNTGQVSTETGRPDDLFSQARQQTDIAEMLARLPPEARAPFEARISALEHPPIVAAPEDSTVGATHADPLYSLEGMGLARGGRFLGRLLGWFALGSRAMNSPSTELRYSLLKLLQTHEMLHMNVPTADRPYGSPTPRDTETVLKRWEGRWYQGRQVQDDLFREYKARPAAAGEAPKKMGFQEFDQEVGKAMRRVDRHPIPEVAKAAAEYRRIVVDPLKVEAQQRGLLPTQGDLLGGTAESYLNRKYDVPKIKENPADWHQTLVAGFMKQGVEAAEAADIAHAVTRNILGTERGMLDFNDTVFRDIVPQSGRLQARQLLLPDKDLEKYLVSDASELMRSYVKTLAPQVEIMKSFPGDDRHLSGVQKAIKDEYSILQQRALAAGDNLTWNKLGDRLKADLRDLQVARDRMYGIFGVPNDPSAWYIRAQRVLRSSNVFRLLGSANWSHPPDIANVIMRRGLPGTMATAAKMATSLDALRLSREEIHRIGGALDMVTNTTASTAGDFGAQSGYRIQDALARGSRYYTIATLETPWITMNKMIAGMATHDEILQAASRVGAGQPLSRIESIRFNQMGIGQQHLERIAREFADHGQTVNGLRFGMTDQWLDKGAAEALDAATLKAGDASVLHPSKGDTPNWTSYEIGRSLFQFKTFGAVAIRKVLIPLAQGIAHGDLRSAQGLAALIAAGAFSYVMKQKLAGQPIETKPDRFALEVLDKSNLLGWTGEYFYPNLWQWGVGNFSRWSDRKSYETLLGPVGGEAADAFDLRLPAKVIGQFRPGDPRWPHIDRDEIHRIRRLAPFQNYWPLRQQINHLEGYVGDQLGLPPEAPRGSTE